MNEIDKFRNDFFEKVIAQEKEKEQKQKRMQANCFHQYDIIGSSYASGKRMYQERMCSKCNHSDIRLLQVWEGTKRGKCVVM